MSVKIGELEDLFERYRSEQDLRALAKLFDLAAPELLRLAVHMAPDVASAEDLVQQTFLVAIEKPKRWRAGEPLLPWFFGILSKLAKKQRRHARRTPEPDRLAPRRAEDPARHALDAETRSAIRLALDGLPELYREVVRASLLEEKPPHEIARELERAPGTVRMQLLRGLELLRRALPAGLAGGALALCGTRGEAAIKSFVLEKAGAKLALGAGTGALAASTLTLGGLLVSTKSIVAVLALVAGLCTWLLWPRPAQPGDIVGYGQDQYGLPVVTRLDESGHERIERRSAADEAPTRDAVPVAESANSTAPNSGGVFLVGKILGAAPEHLAEIELQAGLPNGSANGKPRADGSFEIDLAPAGPDPREKQSPLGFTIRITPPKPEPGATSQIDLWARHPRYISEREVISAIDLFAPLAPGERREIRCELTLRPAAVVTGRVRVPSGWKLEEADVVLARRDVRTDLLDEFQELEHSGCDAEGRYAIKSVRSGRQLVRAELPGLLPVAVYANLEPGSVLELPDLVLEESYCRIRGRLDVPASLLNSQGGLVWRGSGFTNETLVSARRVESGTPAASPGALGGTVLDERSAAAQREVRGGWTVTRQTCTIGSDRGFELRGLEPGAWELSVEGLQGNGTLPLLETTIVEAPAEGIVLGEQLGSITFHVHDSKGAIEGAGVTVGDGSTFSSYTTDKEGRIVLVGDLRKDYTASASAPGRDKASLELPTAGRAREATFELRLSDAPACATLIFRPADPARAPKAVQVHLDPDEGSGLLGRNESLALTSGHYELGGVLPGHWKISVGPTEEQIPVAFYGGFLQSERFDVQLAPGERRERELRCEIGGRLRITIEADASLKSNGFGCTLVSLEGRAVDEPIFVSAVSGEGFGMFSASEHLMITGERTQIALQECLAPGRYELRIPSDNVRAEPLRFEIKVGETTQAAWRIAR